MLLREVALEQRPRERLVSCGIGNLSDAEVLALILEKGSVGENVVDLAHRLIANFGLERLNELSLNEFMSLKGIGMAKACKLMAAFELSKRVSSGKIIGKRIESAADVYDYYKDKLKDLKKEHFYALLLDSKNGVIGEELISVGTLNSSLVHPREVFKEAIKESANAIILVHNHPSGDSNSSREDELITKKIIQAGEFLNIKVIDHVIIGKDDWWSLKKID